MAQVNPDPHAQGYVFIPTNRVTGLFASYGVIGVLMDGKEAMRDQVAAVLKANNAQMVHYWGRLTTERLG
jgi:hypothetical protein